ncbi:uncharacterized protein LOC124451846 isoform X2 [Xenia sp. Carnegie-2017]|uniref:uncharacterized protein LOC124451846 isoform X2 n=1 Tax=Xenia sp. Carnegie-2017 TaxID=2897299 RepID=UPI001F033712|nr:uncharacterized protein LOC124451846 isoform X2 [Xenia sp. Carnegie-2017]
MRIYPFEGVFLQLPFCVRFSNKDVKTIKEQKHLKSLTCFAVFTQFRCINFASALCLNRGVYLQSPYCVRFSINKKTKSFTVYPWIYAMMSLMIWWLLWLLFGQGFTMKMGWNEELEFCEEEWKKFVADKIEIDSKCNNIRTRCCVEEKKYLLERFKMFSEICPLEGTCGCSQIILNITEVLPFRLLRKALYEKLKEAKNFTCSHKYINEKVEYGNRIRYTSFGIRQYKFPSKYVLYGGKSHTCYVVMNVNLKRQDTNGFFIKHVQSGKCVGDNLPFNMLYTMNCFEKSAYFKFLQSGSINRSNTTRCLVRYGIYVDLSDGNFNEECGAINTITQTNWGGLFYKRFNKCIVAKASLELVSCKNEEDQRFNFGKLSNM